MQIVNALVALWITSLWRVCALAIGKVYFVNVCEHCGDNKKFLACANGNMCAQKYASPERENGTYICDTSLFSYNFIAPKVYECNVTGMFALCCWIIFCITEASILGAFGLMYSTIYCENLNSTSALQNATCSLQVWTKEGCPPWGMDKGYQAQIFFCDFYSCKQTIQKVNNVLTVQFDCQSTHCQETGHYPVDFMMEALFQQMVGPAKFTCNMETMECIVTRTFCCCINTIREWFAIWY